MLKIRQPTDSDTPAVLSMARAMHAESPRFRGMTFADEKALIVINHMIVNGGGFIAERDGVIIGMIGGLIAEQYFSYDRYVSDLVVYVAPEYRGGSTATRLIKIFEEWAFSQDGVGEVVLGVSTGVHPEATVCVYERLGYTLSAYGLMKTRGERV